VIYSHNPPTLLRLSANPPSRELVHEPRKEGVTQPPVHPPRVLFNHCRLVHFLVFPSAELSCGNIALPAAFCSHATLNEWSRAARSKPIEGWNV
jgi:hypothetical protein